MLFILYPQRILAFFLHCNSLTTANKASLLGWAINPLSRNAGISKTELVPIESN